MRPPIIDLDIFAGGGGLAIGLAAAGFTPLHLVENDKLSCETLRRNLKSKSPSLQGEVREASVTAVDWRGFRDEVRLVAAGPPCQPFSLGGKHKAAEDGRNLFPEAIRAVREIRPKAVLIENVRGLLREDFHPYFQYILRQLECPSIKPSVSELWQEHDRRIRRHQRAISYHPEYWVSFALVDAADFGVPQNRLRVFIVATRYDLEPFRFPAPTHSRAALLRDQDDGEYWGRHKVKATTMLSVRKNERPCADGLLPWRTVRDAIADLPRACHEETGAWMNHWSVSGARSYAGHTGSSWDWPAKTVKAGVHGVPGGENILALDDGGVRYFTMRELARIQTFPDNHFFEGARLHVTRQIGNAVPCKLAEAIARPLHILLTAESQSERKGRRYAAAAGI